MKKVLTAKERALLRYLAARVSTMAANKATAAAGPTTREAHEEAAQSLRFVVEMIDAIVDGYEKLPKAAELLAKHGDHVTPTYGSTASISERMVRRAGKFVRIARPEGATKLVFKHEDDHMDMTVGPLWWRMADGKCQNVVDSTETRHDGARYAEWFDLPEARKIAAHFKMPLEEV